MVLMDPVVVVAVHPAVPLVGPVSVVPFLAALLLLEIRLPEILHPVAIHLLGILHPVIRLLLAVVCVAPGSPLVDPLGYLLGIRPLDLLLRVVSKVVFLVVPLVVLLVLRPS